MDLETFWFCLIVVVWAMYFLLEGFDFGVGMLLPFVPRSDEERSHALRTIGPVWDGNEVWLVMAGEARVFRRSRRGTRRCSRASTSRSCSFSSSSSSASSPSNGAQAQRLGGALVDVGEHDRQLRRPPVVGDRGPRCFLDGTPIICRVTSPATSSISSARTACSRALPSWRFFAFHGATFSSLSRMRRSTRHPAPAQAVAEGRHPGRVGLDTQPGMVSPARATPPQPGSPRRLAAHVGTLGDHAVRPWLSCSPSRPVTGGRSR